MIKVEPVETRIVGLDAIDLAAERLRAGALVALPTETVYGLAALASSAEAVAGIFEAKGRPPTNPLIVHVADAEQARSVVSVWPTLAQTLADAFWPGPLTLVLPRAASVPDVVTAGLDSVAVRAPAHPVFRKVLQHTGPLAAPSANRSNGVSPTRAEHVLSSLGGRIELIVDGGPCEVGIESTVLSLLHEPTVLRLGAITPQMLREVIGEVAVRDAIEEGARRSPGTGARHYAPDAELLFVARGDADALEDALALGGGALVHTLVPPNGARARRLPDDPVAFAQGLYAALHELDADHERIVIEDVPDTAEWAAVRDRLRRASRRDPAPSSELR